MNHRNRVKACKCQCKAGEAGYDPFSCHWTRSKNYFQSNSPKTQKEATAHQDQTVVRNPSGLGNMEGPGGVHNAFMLAYMAQKGQLEPTCRGVHASDQGLLAPLSFSLSCGRSSISLNQVHNCVKKSQHSEEPFQRVKSNDGRQQNLTFTAND
ncbi:unnamed protein product [Sphagnum tenellum]